MERVAMVGCLVGKGAECSDVHSDRIEDTTPLRPRPGTNKGQDLDVERFYCRVETMRALR